MMEPRRSEAAAGSSLSKHKRLTRRELLTLATVVAAGVGTSTFLQNLPHSARQLTLTPTVRAVLDDPGSPRVGAADADVTIVVFTDYQCPICKITDPALERLIATDTKVRVIFKDWPIFGEASKAAARAVLVADRQGKYLAFHHTLMAARVKLDPDQIQQIAVATGVD